MNNLNIKVIAIIIFSSVVMGALGGLLFQLFVFPRILQNSYFAQFQFIKNFNEGKIVINTKEQIYIQENIALQSSIENIEKAVVQIQTKTVSATIIGSGLIITSDGLIVVLADLVPVGGTYSVFLGEDKVKAQILRRDPKSNLALLKVEGSNLKTCRFSDPSKIKLGQRIFLLGRMSSDLSLATNEGTVRSIAGDSINTNIIEATSFGGSPLFDISGSLVGLTTIDKFGKVSAISVQKIKEFSGL